MLVDWLFSTLACLMLDGIPSTIKLWFCFDVFCVNKVMVSQSFGDTKLCCHKVMTHGMLSPKSPCSIASGYYSVWADFKTFFDVVISVENSMVEKMIIDSALPKYLSPQYFRDDNG